MIKTPLEEGKRGLRIQVSSRTGDLRECRRLLQRGRGETQPKTTSVLSSDRKPLLDRKRIESAVIDFQWLRSELTNFVVGSWEGMCPRPPILAGDVSAEVGYTVLLCDLRGEHVSPFELRKKPAAQSQTFVFDDSVIHIWRQPPLLFVHGPTTASFDNIIVYIVVPFHSIPSFYFRQRGPYTEVKRYKH